MGQTGIFGKHPAFGDFIGAGLSKPMQVGLEEWLGAVLPRVRDNLGHVWQAYYDIALPLRFWLGEDVCPRDVGGPVAGVLVFSHDKVGRRFPLIALREAGDMPPPTLVPDQRWYDALQARMLEHDTPDTAAELAAMLDPGDGVLPAGFEGGEAAFWAVHRAGQVEELLGNVAATDHRRASARRSYWWCAGDPSRTATFHVMEGWPDAAVLQWLIAGNPAEEEPEPDPVPAFEAAPEFEPESEPEFEPEPEAEATPDPEPEPIFETSEMEAEQGYVPVSDPFGLQPDPFLETAAVAASAAAVEDSWSADAVAKPPKALYVEPESDGPESPFSRRELAEAAGAAEADETASDEDAPEKDTAAEADTGDAEDAAPDPSDDPAKDRLAGEGE